jgi:homospermidine synthase
VTAPVVAGVIWALRHPDRGVVEPEEMDHAEIMDFIRPYLGEVVGEYSDWTPCRIAAGCSRKTSTATTPGSSRISASSDSLR